MAEGVPRGPQQEWPSRSPKRTFAQMADPDANTRRADLQRWLQQTADASGPSRYELLRQFSPSPLRQHSAQPSLNSSYRPLTLPTNNTQVPMFRNVYDYRRPANLDSQMGSVASAPRSQTRTDQRAEETVIDLTEADGAESETDQAAARAGPTRSTTSRPQYTGTIVIDDDDDNDDVQDGPARSPDFEIVGERLRNTPPPPAPDPPRFLVVSDNEEDDDDEVQFVSETVNPNPSSNPRQMFFLPDPTSFNPYLVQLARRNAANVAYARSLQNPELQRALGGGNNPRFDNVRLAPMLTGAATRGAARAAAAVRGIAGNFRMPNMDYNNVAFNLMGFNQANNDAAGVYPQTLHQTRSESPIPTLPPLDEGFYRAPPEDEAIVCPHCGDELATGSTDLKKQVWVVRTCGHAYCGECATNRFKSAKKLTGSTVEPFSQCRVENCKSSLKAKTAMLQIYF